MSGRWDQPGVPHKSWVCVSSEDLGAPTHICEMCGKEQIRWIHSMRHSDYPGEMVVGCVCAEKMETDYQISPRRREAKLKARAKSRSTWLERRWRVSAKGSQTLKHQGALFLVAETPFGWRAAWKLAQSPDWTNLDSNYHTDSAAKLAAFDARYPSRISIDDLLRMRGEGAGSPVPRRPAPAADPKSLLLHLRKMRERAKPA